MSRFPIVVIALVFLALPPSYSAAQVPAAPGLALPPPAAREPMAASRQSSWREDFEGAVPSWTEAGGDAPYTLVAHQRVRGAAHSGQGSEWFQVLGQGGNVVLVAHDVGRPWVIDELRPSVWIFADRPGIQFLAEVTLPRALDPRSGKALTTQVSSPVYSTANRWQQLQIADFSRRLADQVRILRSQFAMNIDPREAFVSRVLLNICGGPGLTNVWIDDLEVFGHVPSAASASAAAARPGYALAALGGLPPGGSGPAAAALEPPRREVKLANSILTINGYPIFPRCIEYRGEHLAYLKQLGFNAVWLRQVPARAFLQEARQLGMWLVCPPPELPADSQATIGPEFEPVLVWDLGHGLTGETLEAVRQRANLLCQADTTALRPLIGAPVNNLRNYSRDINLLLIDRRPLGTSLEMPNYGAWIRRQPLLALPGTPIWTTVQTQVGEGLRRQFAMLTPNQAPPTVVGPEQIRLLVYTAISSGSRGLFFLSDSSLEGQDAETRQRAAVLELLNVELQVIEPWAAAGDMVAMAECNQPLVSGAILRDDRARIVMPMWLAPGSQCVAPVAAANPLVLTLPGIPESSNIFELTAGRLQPLRHRREAGGTRVTVDEFGLSDLLFLAQDPAIIEAVTRRAAASGKQTAELERNLAAQKRETAMRVLGQIGGRMPALALNNPPAKDFALAAENLQLCDARLTSGDYAMASAYARRATMALRRQERLAWEAALKGRASPVEIPGTSSFEALPWHWALVDRTATLRAGANRLPGGDFENIAAMVRDGWRNFQPATPGIQTAADLVPTAAHSGLMGLRLTARAENPEHPPAAIEMPPLWITSPAVPVAAGQIVRIRGWVNVPTAITGSVDGLEVVESLTGEEMALRLDKTNGWQQFSMLRVVPQTGPLTLTLWMTGLGEVRLDDLSIEVLEPAR